MKILYIAYSCDPYNGSEDQIGWNIPFESAKAGNDVYVLTKEEQRKNIEKYCEKNDIFNIKFYYVDILDIYKKIFKGFLFSTRIYFWMKEAFKLSKKICNENSIEIIHQITPVEFRMIGKFKKIKQIKFIVGPIGGGVNTPKSFRKYGKERAIIEFIRESANKFFSFRYKFGNCEKKYDYIMYSNEETANIFEKNNFCEDKLYTEIGINEKNICSYKDFKEINIVNFIVVGRLIYLKGHDFLLDVIEKIDISKKFIVTIVGDGPKYEKIYNRVNNSSVLKNRVKLLGRIDFDEMNKVYDDAHVLILPSIRENTGTVVLEAMSRGVPVISYNGFGAKLIVNEKNGWLYNGMTTSDNINNLKTIIENILDNPNDIKIKSKRALDDAKQYTWNNKINRFGKIYKKMLGDMNEKK